MLALVIDPRRIGMSLCSIFKKRKEGNIMSVPSKANIDKLDNPARSKTNPQAVTEPSV